MPTIQPLGGARLLTVAMLCALAWPLQAPAQEAPAQEAAAQEAAAQEAPAQAQAPDRELVIGTKLAPPFAMKDEKGNWNGLSIDLWRAAASDLGLHYHFEEVDLATLIDGLHDGRLDASVAALTVTAEREAIIDFTHSILPGGLGIAVGLRPGSSPASMAMERLGSGAFLRAAGGLTLLLMAVGLLIWLCERKANSQQFAATPVRGIGSGMWWSAVTMTTVGYGDKAPRSLIGRLVGGVWMFASIILISSFTASIAASLTIGQLRSDIRGPDDLSRVVSGCVSSSTGEAYVRRRHFPLRVFPTLEQACAALAEGSVQAVVHDRPLMQFQAGRGDIQIHVLPVSFERQGYAFGLPPGSPLREALNLALLDRMSSTWWQDRIAEYLGD